MKKHKAQTLSTRSKWLPRILAIPVILFIAVWPVFMPNGVAGFSHDPYERYLAEKVLEYRHKFDSNYGFDQPLKTRVVKVESGSTNPDETYRFAKNCSSIPRQHFDENFNRLYSKTYYVHEYGWFGSHKTEIVGGCALYKVGV